jgi:hypothetical protein
MLTGQGELRLLPSIYIGPCSNLDICPLQLYLQHTMVLAASFDLCPSVVVTDENLNFLAVRSPIELKLGGDLGLVS